MPNLNELIEAEMPREASDEERGLLSYIIGKDYQSCETFELDLNSYGIIPYFKVISAGAEYGSEAMGLGEIFVHYLLYGISIE
jgi:hypothetical protein